MAVTHIYTNTAKKKEFYFYLIKQGYSHKQISDHWHFLNEDKYSKVTFDEFWKGYKAMAQNVNIAEEEEQKEVDNQKKRVRSPSKVIEIDLDDIDNPLSAVKEKLRKSSHKMNESEFKAKVGKVVENEVDDQKDTDDNKNSNVSK